MGQDLARFGSLLHEYIERIDMSQDVFRRRIGVSRRTVARWLRGIQRPRSRAMVAKVFREVLFLTRRQTDELLCYAGYRPEYATDCEQAHRITQKARRLETLTRYDGNIITRV